ncbi:MAG: quinone-dependent dihydroorotate dehydrogenase [Bacteroidales bacterium]|jgi:dihydroorotate dehydrogenase|nr:quinone-dependent dihydroorotate dehydrogenase [Bacteroidales bacterium]
MSDNYWEDKVYRFFRSILFLFPAEASHRLVAVLMRMAYAIPPVRVAIRWYYGVRNPLLEREFCGIRLANPVGLAAGFDKNAKLYKAFSMLGFSFIEIGTVTPVGQPGNPKPRLFRIVQDSALINRMGFNNEGVEAVVKRLKSSRPNIVIGGNIGKNTHTSNTEAPFDYLYCFDELYPYVDYFTVNVSCPNVAGLSALQDPELLADILRKIINKRNTQKQRKPVLVKISPDLSIMQLDGILKTIEELGIDGIVAANTTTQRNHLTIDRQTVEALGNGGLSGEPLKWKTLEVINYIRQRTKGKLPVIGTGGIMKEEDAISLINAGASLVQLYSGLIYQGPSLVKKINKAILRQHSD